MNRRLKRFKVLLTFELTTHYSFPFLEGIIAVTILLAFYFMASTPLAAHYLILPTLSANESAALVAAINQWIALHAAYHLGGWSLRMSVFLSFLVPLLTSLSFARDMDQGMFRTLCSYPIARSQLLLSKELIVLIATCGTATLSLILGLITFEPGPVRMDILILCILVVWAPLLFVSTVTALIAILSKSLPASLFGGIGVSIAMQALSYFRSVPAGVASFLNPSIILIQYIQEDFFVPLLVALVYGIMVSIIASGIFMIIGVDYFKKMEA
ncbi:MAG: ABC transporter permease [Candidatus Thorarchaeota archaeon]|nr:ABC transporter permease [Candidatus Thorarchaeota archaeon]